ncbi:MAG: cytochrome c [Verrucomicrobiota bacterium]
MRTLFKWFLLLLPLALIGGGVIWYKAFRVVKHAPYASDEEWFKHGSLGGEARTGLPYWIWATMPRIFPDLMPGPGGYAAFGLVWEPGSEMPVGFTKEKIGFPRVGNNCALCHTATYRASEQSPSVVVIGAPAHRFNPQALFQFLTAAARDSRFNADNFLTEIKKDTQLDVVDRLLYRFAIIPMTRKALIEQGEQIAWMTRSNRPAWGPGRDDAFNLPKFMLAHLPDDGTAGQCDFGSVWNLRVRQGTNLFMNWGGESRSLETILVDSSVGFQPKPGAAFDADMKRLGDFLTALPAPKYPFKVDEINAAKGQPLYEKYCASCHEVGAERTSKIIPLDEIGTDRERLNSWTQAAADKSNAAIKKLGFHRPDMVKSAGYLSPPLDGIWLRAPYLHNGSVPTLRDLLEPVEKRPTVFYRGYDVFDPVNVGFITRGPSAERKGWKHDVTVRGDSNQGHNYGTGLTEAEKSFLVEYLKTL